MFGICYYNETNDNATITPSGTASTFELTPVLTVGIFIGILTALVCIAVGTAMALKLRTAEQLRRRRHHQQHDSQFDKPFSTRPGNLPIKDKISLPLGVADLDEIYDDKNPDVVPYNEGTFNIIMYTHTPYTNTYRTSASN